MKSLLNFLLFSLLSWWLLPGCEPIKTKTMLDRVYELDPKGKIYVSRSLMEKFPGSVAVLPFHSLVGEGRIERSRPLFNFLTGRREIHPESLAENMRRAFFGQFAQLEFDHVRLPRVDRILKKEGLDSWGKIRSIAPQRLAQNMSPRCSLTVERTSMPGTGWATHPCTMLPAAGA